MLSVLKDRLTITNYVCGLLALAMLVVQFLPFWSFDYTRTYSVEVEVPIVEEPVEDEEAEEAATSDEEATEAEELEEAEPKTEIAIEEREESVSATLSLAAYEWLPTTEASVALTEQYLPVALAPETEEPAIEDEEAEVAATEGEEAEDKDVATAEGEEAEDKDAATAEDEEAEDKDAATAEDEEAEDKDTEKTTTYFSKKTTGKDEEKIGVNDIILVPTIQFVLCLFIIGLCFVAKKNISISIIAIIVGELGSWGYLTNPALGIGSCADICLIISFLIRFVGVIGFVFAALNLVDRRKRRLAALKNKSLEM